MNLLVILLLIIAVILVVTPIAAILVFSGLTLRTVLTLDTRLTAIETYLQQIDADMSGPQGGVQPIFRSADGKYSASSLDELMQKMMEDNPDADKNLDNFFGNEEDDEEDDEDEKGF